MRVFKGRYRMLFAAIVVLLVAGVLAGFYSWLVFGSMKSGSVEEASTTSAPPVASKSAPAVPAAPADAPERDGLGNASARPEPGRGGATAPAARHHAYRRARPDATFAALDRAVTGSAGISAPRTAVVNTPFRVMLRVDTRELGAVLKSLADELPENETRVGASDVRLTPRMSATLVGSGFKVTPEFDNPVQAVSGGEPTTWSWQVEAARPGTLYLSITLSQILTVEGKEVGRFHEFSRTIQVEAKPFSVREFVGDYWQWLGTIVIIPLAKALWDRWSTSRKPARDADGAP